MSKIEIDNLVELINKDYPLEYVKNIINNVLSLSLQVKGDYPDYKQWYLSKQVPGIYDGSRNIIVAHIDDKIIGFVSLKKEENERKICTFYIAETFRRNKIGFLLVKRAVEWLECDKPLITIPLDKLGGFIKISKKYGWIVTDIKEGLYRINNPEIIVNGFMKDINLESSDIKQKQKSISRLWFFYCYNKFINTFKLKRLIVEYKNK